MPRKDIIEGYTVTATISVSEQFSVTEKQAKREADNAAALIKTHVAPHAMIEPYIEVRAQIDSKCEFCGSAWTEDDDQYNGGCCENDQKLHERGVAT